MKKQGIICFMVILTLLLALSAVAWAEVYVEGFLGGTTATNLGRASSISRTFRSRHHHLLRRHHHKQNLIISVLTLT
jgi:hypothetical protein